MRRETKGRVRVSLKEQEGDKQKSKSITKREGKRQREE